MKVGNLLVNLVSTMGAYCFFDNKPQALAGLYIENTSKQLELF